jgi:hypothetical protein
VYGIMQDFKKDVVDMLENNQSLLALGVYSSARPLKFPQITIILHAAANHPRRRKICFYPPTEGPPQLAQIDFFQLWLKRNRSSDIQFKDFGYSDLRAHLPTWQKTVLSAVTDDFDALQQVEDKRIRSHLFVKALATELFYKQILEKDIINPCSNLIIIVLCCPPYLVYAPSIN